MIALDPSYVDAYNARGVANNRLGNISEAFADYEQALRVNPKFDEARRNINRLRNALREDGEQRALDQMNRVRNAR